MFYKWDTLPEMMGWFHIFGIVLAVVFFIVGIVLGIKLKGKSEDYICRILLIVGSTLVGIEILQKILKYIDLGYFNWSEIPFHICHVAMYVFVAAGIFKKGKVRDYLLAFSGLAVFGVSTFYFANPVGAVEDPYILSSFYSFLYHSILIACSLIVMISLEQYSKPAFKTCLRGYAFTMLLTPIAILINELVYRNFPEFSNINLFTISAHLPVGYPLLKNIIDINEVPYPVYLLSYMIYFFVIGTLLYFVIRLVYILIDKLKKRRNLHE